MLHLIQPRFRNIFGEHYYRQGQEEEKEVVRRDKRGRSKDDCFRTVISSMSCTSTKDSMVVEAYVLLDPSTENLYFSATPWYLHTLFPSSEM